MNTSRPLVQRVFVLVLAALGGPSDPDFSPPSIINTSELSNKPVHAAPAALSSIAQRWNCFGASHSSAVAVNSSTPQRRKALIRPDYVWEADGNQIMEREKRGRGELSHLDLVFLFSFEPSPQNGQDQQTDPQAETHPGRPRLLHTSYSTSGRLPSAVLVPAWRDRDRDKERDGGIRGVVTDRWATSLRSLFLQPTLFSSSSASPSSCTAPMPPIPTSKPRGRELLTGLFSAPPVAGPSGGGGGRTAAQVNLTSP